MENNKFEKIWKKNRLYYKIQSLVLLLVAVLFFLMIAFSFIDIKIILILEIIAFVIIIKLIKKRRMMSTDMILRYPEEIEKKVLSGKYINKYDICFLRDIQFYKGDVQGCINIGLKILNDKNIKSFTEIKYQTFSILAISYFLAENFDRLSEIISVMSSKAHDSKRVLKCKSKFNQISLFYSNYIDGDFENCKSVCNTILSTINPVKEKPRYITYTYLLAVSHYKLGEYDSAKVLFENIIAQYPNNVYGQLSQKYVDAMESGSEYQPITFDDSIVSNEETDVLAKYHKRIKRIGFICYICICLSVFALMNLIFNKIQGCDFFGYYYQIEDCRESDPEYYEGGVIIATVRFEDYCFDFVVNEDEESFSIIRMKCKNERYKHAVFLSYEKRTTVDTMVEYSSKTASKGWNDYYDVYNSGIDYLILPADIQIPNDITETYRFQYKGEELVLGIRRDLD